MAATPPVAAPPVAPTPAPSGQKARPHRTPVWYHAVIAGTPSLALAGGFLAMIFHAVPKDNHDYVIAIVSGLLGYLTHAAASAAKKPAGAAQ